VALFYEKIRLDLVSHNSVDVLSKFAIEVSVQNEDELKKLKAARKCAFRFVFTFSITCGFGHQFLISTFPRRINRVILSIV